LVLVPEAGRDEIGAGDFMAGKVVLSGDDQGLLLISAPFDGFVWRVTLERPWDGTTSLECERYPAELLTYEEPELALADRLVMIMRLGSTERHQVKDLAYKFDLDVSVKDVLGVLTELLDAGLVMQQANWWSLTESGEARRQKLHRRGSC
jgi:hypothetical protein